MDASSQSQQLTGGGSIWQVLRIGPLLFLLGVHKEQVKEMNPEMEPSDEEKALAESFLKFDYVETKDLCKQFLALVASLLVFSVTFSEKIVDFEHAPLVPKLLLVASWFLFLLAIIATGAALYLMFNAGIMATYRPERERRRTEIRFFSFRILNVAGAAFVLGLLVLIASGLYRFHR